MNSIREILRLKFSCKMSERGIATSLGLSRTAVWECLQRADAAGISWPIPEGVSELQLYAQLYPQPESKRQEKAQVDCEYIFRELKRDGVTLSLLWEEYKRESPNGYQYTQFCEIYRNWLEKATSVMRQTHKAGHKAFSDFSGGTLNIVDPSTGEVIRVPLFVCTLGASNFTYAELFESQNTEAWCSGHAHAFQYFGGTPAIVVPDNPRTVVSKACPYEPQINPDFMQLAQHYDIAVVPARVAKPKDKAKVENAVGVATRWILAKLRNETFFSVAEANCAVRRLTEDLNDRRFKKISDSRRSLFERVEKAHLKPLPPNKYEYVHIVRCRVGKDYHIEIDDCAYSVPHHLVQEMVEVRVSRRAVEILSGGSRVASHACLPNKKTYTLNEHMPPSHRAYNGFTPEALQRWALEVGPATGNFVRELFARKRTPELGVRASLGLTKLARRHGDGRLESACARAIEIRSFSYKTVKLILQNNTPQLAVNEVPQLRLTLHANVRGLEYFINKEGIKNANTSDIGSSTPSEVARDGERAGNAAPEPGAERSVV